MRLKIIVFVLFCLFQNVAASPNAYQQLSSHFDLFALDYLENIYEVHGINAMRKGIADLTDACHYRIPEEVQALALNVFDKYEKGEGSNGNEQRIKQEVFSILRNYAEIVETLSIAFEVLKKKVGGWNKQNSLFHIHCNALLAFSLKVWPYLNPQEVDVVKKNLKIFPRSMVYLAYAFDRLRKLRSNVYAHSDSETARNAYIIIIKDLLLGYAQGTVEKLPFKATKGSSYNRRWNRRIGLNNSKTPFGSDEYKEGIKLVLKCYDRRSHGRYRIKVCTQGGVPVYYYTASDQPKDGTQNLIII